MQIPYSGATDGSAITFGPFPFAARGVTVVNSTNKDATVTDDRGIANVVKASTIVSFPPHPTHYLTVKLAAAAAALSSITVYVSDTEVPITSSGLALPASSGMIFDHNGTLVATEPGVDLVDANGIVWTMLDVPGSSLVRVTPSLALLVSHTELTGGVNITGTTPAAPTTLITAPAFTFDGVTRYDFEFFVPVLATNATGREVDVYFYEDGNVKELIDEFVPSAAAQEQKASFAKASFVPTAGSHTYSARAVTPFGGTAVVFAGDGLAGHYAPGFLRIRRSPV